LPLADSLGLTVQPESVSELVALAEDLIALANAERALLPEDEAGLAYVDRRAVLRSHWEENGNITAIRAKPIMLSRPMSYTMITGVFFPFTGEPNINMAAPAFEVPSTVAHELAHQKGIAREDEANFMAWRQSRKPNASQELRYSGALMALMHTLNAAHRVMPREEYDELFKKISPGVTRDLEASREFWLRHSGPVQEIARSVNDAYLRSNQQADGVLSYGQVVDLLLAERRARR